MSEPNFSKGDVVVKKDDDELVDRALPHSKIEILGVLERLNSERENLYMIPQGRPINCKKVDRNYKLKSDDSASDD